MQPMRCSRRRVLTLSTSQHLPWFSPPRSSLLQKLRADSARPTHRGALDERVGAPRAAANVARSASSPKTYARHFCSRRSDPRVCTTRSVPRPVSCRTSHSAGSSQLTSACTPCYEALRLPSPSVVMAQNSPMIVLGFAWRRPTARGLTASATAREGRRCQS